jgi:hypothetical protein
MQPRRQQPSQPQASTQLTSPVLSAPLQTANVTAVEAMNVDNTAIVPLRTAMVTAADNMHVDTTAMVPLSTPLITSTPPQLQSQGLHTHGHSHQLNPSSMLQFNQFNIRQTQVRVQVTTQPDMSPTLEANQRHHLPIAITSTMSLNNQMVPMTVQHSPQQQSDLPIPPSGLILTPPTQQLQRTPGVHPGQLRNTTIDKGKSVLSHAPQLDPQTLTEHINLPQPLEQLSIQTILSSSFRLMQRWWL